MNKKITELMGLYAAAVEGATDTQVVAAYKTRGFATHNPCMASHVSKNLQWFDVWSSFLKEHRLTCPPHALDNLISIRDAIFSEDVAFGTTEIDVQVDNIFNNIIGSLLSSAGLTVSDIPQVKPGIAVLALGLAALRVDQHINYDQLKTLLERAWASSGEVEFVELITTNSDIFASIDYVTINHILGKLCDENLKAAKEVKSGSVKAVGFFVGRVLKEMKVDPAALRQHVINFCGNTID